MKTTTLRTVTIIRNWYAEGRIMPGYMPGNGTPYIAYLLGVWDGPLGPPFKSGSSQRSFEALIETKAPGLIEQLGGPHGWALLKALIARKEGKHDNEPTAGIQDVSGA